MNTNPHARRLPVVFAASCPSCASGNTRIYRTKPKSRKRYCKCHDCSATWIQKPGDDLCKSGGVRPGVEPVVYFIADELRRMVKIGIASKVSSRLAALQIGSPVKLILLATVAGGKSLESKLHARFGEYRSHGEWFYFSPAIARFVEALALEPGAIGACNRDTSSSVQLTMYA